MTKRRAYVSPGCHHRSSRLSRHLKKSRRPTTRHDGPHALRPRALRPHARRIRPGAHLDARRGHDARRQPRAAAQAAALPARDGVLAEGRARGVSSARRIIALMMMACRVRSALLIDDSLLSSSGQTQRVWSARRIDRSSGDSKRVAPLYADETGGLEDRRRRPERAGWGVVVTCVAENEECPPFTTTEPLREERSPSSPCAGGRARRAPKLDRHGRVLLAHRLQLLCARTAADARACAQWRQLPVS